jgi:hypothetical protein
MNPNEPGLRPHAVRWLCAVALAASLVTVTSPALAAESGNVDGTFTPVLSGACILIDGPSSIDFGNVQRGGEFQFGTPSNVRIVPCAPDYAYEIAVSATDATTTGPTPSTISLAGPETCPTVENCIPTGNSFALQTNEVSPIYRTPQTVATIPPNQSTGPSFAINLKVSSQLDTATFGQAFSFDVTFTAFLE